MDTHAHMHTFIHEHGLGGAASLEIIFPPKMGDLHLPPSLHFTPLDL